MELNENQREAVEDESSACLVKANVGSGKTTVLIEKIRYLHEKKKIPMEEMLVLTFTNRAADEIRERLGREVCIRKGKPTGMEPFTALPSLFLNRYCLLRSWAISGILPSVCRKKNWKWQRS